MARIWFDNGYGASIIDDPFFDGLEIAIIAGSEDEWEIIYDTPITDDTIRGLSSKQAGEIFDRIKALPAR